MISLKIANYTEQREAWPLSGNHILAQYDDDSVIVYQAYNPSIGRFATENNYFGGDFSYSRMSWIKPNFLWMMYRSGWGIKKNQEVTLAIRLKRSFFDLLLSEAIHSSFDSRLYCSREEWQQKVASSNVRLQWDPDHKPLGARLQRRAIQLGLRGKILEGFRGSGIIAIENISDFVAEQRQFTQKANQSYLKTPLEKQYPVMDLRVREHLGIGEI